MSSDPYLDLADDASLRMAINARSEERARQDRAADLATWVGTLRDLAERRVPVVVRTGHGRTHRGVLAAIGVDHLAVRSVNGSLVLVAMDTVRLVRPDPSVVAPAAMGDREVPHDRTIAEELEFLVERAHVVAVVVRGLPDPLRGEVAGLGEDVLTLGGVGADRGTIYLPLAAIAELMIDER